MHNKLLDNDIPKILAKYNVLLKIKKH